MSAWSHLIRSDAGLWFEPCRKRDGNLPRHASSDCDFSGCKRSFQREIIGTGISIYSNTYNEYTMLVRDPVDSAAHGPAWGCLLLCGGELSRYGPARLAAAGRDNVQHSLNTKVSAEYNDISHKVFRLVHTFASPTKHQR